MTKPSQLRITLAQLNPIVGDVEGNLVLAREAREIAKAENADLLVFSELFLSGYPPEDLVLKCAFQAACLRACEALAEDTSDGAGSVLIGLPYVQNGKLYNAMALLMNGKIAHVRFKVDLPNYGVFDEKRVFTSGDWPEPISFKGLTLGVPICEDMWKPDVTAHLARQPLDLLIVPNGSPYGRGKTAQRCRLAYERVQQTRTPLLYLNQVGGQDELVFDGSSFIMHPQGNIPLQMARFGTQIVTIAFEKDEKGYRVCLPLSDLTASHDLADLNEDQADYTACVLGLRDYVHKNGFKGVVLGLSGGIDSALCAAMAVDALGAEQVRCVMLPSRYTSQHSLNDAAACATALGVRYESISIETVVNALQSTLLAPLGAPPSGITAENLQSRARGILLMALSNATGDMVITTGNKSEMSVGYATLYGDMNGGFNPIKDLYKMEVYRLSALRNHWKPHDAFGPEGAVIPASILTKAPSAELRNDQTDQDSLPPYDILDAILEGLVENEQSVASLIASGFEPATVKRIEHLLHLAEYKRRQAPPGVKVTRRNFGRDRRYPITHQFRE
jgi:NAD+ synthase